MVYKVLWHNTCMLPIKHAKWHTNQEHQGEPLFYLISALGSCAVHNTQDQHSSSEGCEACLFFYFTYIFIIAEITSPAVFLCNTK